MRVVPNESRLDPDDAVTEFPRRGSTEAMDMCELSDAELLAATRSEPEAFAVFYDRYEAAVAGYFMGRAASA